MDKIHQEEEVHLSNLCFKINREIERQGRYLINAKEVIEEHDIVGSCAYSNFKDAQYQFKSSESRIAELDKIIDSPYYARFDLAPKIPHQIENMIFYIGKTQLFLDLKVQIYDWRSEIGDLYYYKEKTDFKYKENDFNLVLRRSLTIYSGKLFTYKNEYVFGDELFESGVTDPFLLEVLLEKRETPKLTDIIKSIQRDQIEIIHYPLDKNIIVQGCAGSGKTMILLHRISYLLYNNHSLMPKKIWIIAPTQLFIEQIDNLISDLNINDIKRFTLANYYLELLKTYNFKIISDIQTFGTDTSNTKSVKQFVLSYNFLENFNTIFNEHFSLLIERNTLQFLSKMAKTIGVEPLNKTADKASEEFIRYLNSINEKITNNQNKLETMKVFFSDEKNDLKNNSELIEQKEKLREAEKKISNIYKSIKVKIDKLEKYYENSLMELTNRLESLKLFKTENFNLEKTFNILNSEGNYQEMLRYISDFIVRIKMVSNETANFEDIDKIKDKLSEIILNIDILSEQLNSLKKPGILKKFSLTSQRTRKFSEQLLLLYEIVKFVDELIDNEIRLINVESSNFISKKEENSHIKQELLNYKSSYDFSLIDHFPQNIKEKEVRT